MNRQNKTKELIHLIILSTILALSITLTILIIVGNSKLSKTQQFLMKSTDTSAAATPHPEETQQAGVVKEHLYILGVKDGRLAVYAADGYTVIDILDTYVYSLPLSDREAVSEGIAVYSVNELVSLIQDYTS